MNQTVTSDYRMNIYQTLPLPVIAINPCPDNFEVAFLNKEAEQLLNVTSDLIIESNSSKWISGLFSESKVDLYQQLQLLCVHKENKKIASCKLNIAGAIHSNSYFDVILSPSINEEGVVVQIIALLYEVAESRVTQQNDSAILTLLHQKDKFLRETQRVARNGTWEIDRNTNNIVWSDMLREIYEVGPDFELSFESALSFFKDEDSRRRLSDAVEATLQSGKIFDLELPVLTAKGNEAWLKITGKADLVGGTCTRLYGVTQDITENRKIREALSESLEKLNSLIQTVDGIVWEADAETFQFTFIGNQVESILGYTAEEWLSDPDFWSNHIYPDDKAQALTYCIAQTQLKQNHTFDYRMVKSDGSIVWIRDLVSVIVQQGKPTLIRGIMVDITEDKLLSNLDHLEKKVLELNSKSDIETETLLLEYILGLEKLFPKMKCSVLRVKGNRLYNWVTPSLPEPYVRTINNFEMGPLAGSCGASAYLKQKVIVADIETDPRWTAFKHLLLPYGLRSSWSYPLIDSEDNVIAVLGIYHYVSKTPSDIESSIVERTVAIFNMILENRMKTTKIQESNLLITQGQELANFGTWQWDITENVVTWSDVLYKIYGIEPSNFTATFEFYLSMLHPEDKGRVADLIKTVLETHKDVIFEERIIRPDGEQLTLKSWGRLLFDDDGNPVKMIGACLDITKAKTNQEKLREIAWLQSHVVRAPLTRLIGLADMLKHELSLQSSDEELLTHLVNAAYELDDVIKNISDRTIQ
ncbi:PAS domain-containing protein [Niabella sp. CJ426]|uniref:PAS domain-containing protein n=1 Tax=Niabella sp. CJ426 TaxID=3393740 RepID=UPI003D02EDEE